MRHSFRSPHSAVRIAGIAALLTFVSCLSVTDVPEGLSVLSIVSGNNEEIPAGSSEGLPLVVRTLDETAAPLGGVAVNWTITQGAGTLSAATSLSDASGNASVSYTPPATAGTVQIRAAAEELQVTFTLNVVAQSADNRQPSLGH